jgi:hypothetical protein
MQTNSWWRRVLIALAKNRVGRRNLYVVLAFLSSAVLFLILAPQGYFQLRVKNSIFASVATEAAQLPKNSLEQLAVLVAAPDGNSTFGNGTLTLRTSAAYAGAVSELWFRGHQFVNSHDAGRLFQTAWTYDGHGECYNPTEGGSSHDGAGPSTSRLMQINVAPAHLSASTRPAYWYHPNEPNLYCGKAYGADLVSEDTLRKGILVGWDGDPQTILWQTEAVVAQNHQSMDLEALTGYLNGEFNRFFTYDLESQTLAPLKPIQIEHPDQNYSPTVFPTIVANQDQSLALGSVALDQGVGDTPSSFTSVAQSAAMTCFETTQFTDKTSKWSLQFKYSQANKGVYRSRIFLFVGSVPEVVARIKRFYVLNPNQLVALMATPKTRNHFFDPVYYAAANKDVVKVMGPNPQQLLTHYLIYGAKEGRNGTERFNLKNFVQIHPDLQKSFGAENLIGILKELAIRQAQTPQ